MKTVEIDTGTLHPNPVHRALRLVKTLREEGIPAYGAISLEGVESGALTITAPDLATGKVTLQLGRKLVCKVRHSTTACGVH